MEDRDHIKELFQEKLSGMESSVRPELWNGIASQIGAAAPAAAGISVISKIAIGVGVAASLTLGVYFIAKDTNVEKEKNSESIVQQTPNTTEEETLSNEKIPTSERKEVNNESNETVLPAPLDESTDDLEHDSKIDPKILDRVQDNSRPDRNETEESSHKADQGKANPAISDQDDKKTDIKDATSPESNTVQTEYSLSLPNVFTPNGDGVHDVLIIDSEGLTDFNLIILDIQNKVVWSTSDPDFEWNGIGMNGEPVPAGNYVYFITAKDPYGKAFNKSSRLSIIRTR